MRRLVLVDPTRCFAGFRPGYLLRALPTLLGPSALDRAFLAWETGGAPLDADWLALQERAAAFPAARPVMGLRPAPAALCTLRPPTLVLLGGRSRAHDVRKVASRAAALLPDATVATLPGVSHHALPHARPGELTRAVREFLSGASG